MKKRKITAALAGAVLSAALLGGGAQAAVPESDVSAAFNEAVMIQDKENGIDVSLEETTVVPGRKDVSEKQIEMKASGLHDLDNLKVSIQFTTDDGEKEQYYADGYFYVHQGGKKLKYAMEPETMLEIMNYYVYLDLNSSRLASLSGQNGNYSFSATAETLGDYTDSILEGAQKEHHIQLIAVQGTVETDASNNITGRTIQTVYTLNSGDAPQTCTMNSEVTFHKPGEQVNVLLPDFSEYKDRTKGAAVTVTEQNKTVYTKEDVNVRAANNITSTILGGLTAGEEVQQTGYTDDGWTQISYNGATGYVFAEFISGRKPVVTKDMSGTMYATLSVNVRDQAGTDGAILGVLDGGDAVETTGYTDNNWIRVNYNGQTGYVSRDYLTWDQPVEAMGGTMYAVSQANVRTYYSTDSQIIGMLDEKEAVEVTGYTPNNWIRVNYNGQTGYVYANLLSWEKPQTQAVYSTMSGTVYDASMNTMVIISSADGGYYSFNTTDAYMNTVDGTSIGDTVEIVYQGSRYGMLYAVQVNNYTTHRQSMPDASREGLVYGTVVAYGMSTVTIACNDGQTRSFYKEDAVIESPNGIYDGLYVSAVYRYDSSFDGYVLEAMTAM